MDSIKEEKPQIDSLLKAAPKRENESPKRSAESELEVTVTLETKHRRLSLDYSDDDFRDQFDDCDDADFGNDGLENSGLESRKEPHLVARRNARERKRVQMVNEGFTLLRRQIPTEPKHKKLSKVIVKFHFKDTDVN